MLGYARTYIGKTSSNRRKKRARGMIKSLHALEIILRLSSKISSDKNC